MPQSVRTRGAHQKKHSAELSSDFDSWGFGTEGFTAVPASSTQLSRPISEGNNSQPLGGLKIAESQPATQPAGWAGF